MISYITRIGAGGNDITVEAFLRQTDGTGLGPFSVYIPVSTVSSGADIKAAAPGLIDAFCSTNGVDVPTDHIWLTETTPITPVTPVQSPETRSLVTGTGATGFQVSSTKNAWVNYDVQIVSTASIAGNASGYVALEIAPTNSATAGDWVEIGRLTNAQALTLAITLQSVQTIGGQIGGYVPAGYYAKLRTVTSTGTISFSYISGQKVLY